MRSRLPRGPWARLVAVGPHTFIAHTRTHAPLPLHLLSCQVSTRGWSDHPEFQRRCIVKIQGLIQKKKVASAPRKVRLHACMPRVVLMHVS
jgi:hypothetical protein